jgi:hypothetical protein
MLDFQDLFQWDRFISPDGTDTRNEQGKSYFLGSMEGRSLTGGRL